MNLRDWTSQRRAQVYEALSRGDDPPFGEFKPDQIREARRAGRPQIGTTVFEPWAVRFEFIFSSPTQPSLVIDVKVDTPERVVYLPVPEWVIQSIWEGEVSGSYHFESDALLLMKDFEASTRLEANQDYFRSKS